MTNTGHTPGKDDHRGPWTAQEVNLLWHKLRVAQTRIDGLEQLRTAQTDAILNMVEDRTKLRTTITQLKAKLKIFQTPHPITAPALTPDDMNGISESLTRQTPMLIKMLREHPASVMVSVGELVCDRMVELSVEYYPPDQDDTP